MTIIDANSPADVLETFHITVSPILCIASVPGASEEDYAVDNESLKADLEVDASKSPKPSPTHSTESSGGTDTTQDSGIGSITFVQCATGTTSTNGSKEGTPVGTPPAGKSGKIQVKHDTLYTGNCLENVSLEMEMGNL